MCFSQQHGIEESDQFLMTVTENLHNVQISNKRKPKITDYFYK